MIKLIIAVKRNPALSAAQFVDHLSKVHSALVKDCPATKKYARKYVQSYSVQPDASAEEPAFDGAAELWFDTVADMNRFFGDADYLGQVRPDEGRFADMERTVFFVTTEKQIV